MNKEISGGRVLKNKTRKVQSRAAKAFRLAAQSLKSSNCYLGRFYRKIKAKACGFKGVLLDLEGYRQGSLNEDINTAKQ